MKKVIGVYSEANYVYVQRQLYKLREEGISVESTDVLTLKKVIPTPCFIVIKNGGVVNKLIGKYSDTEFYKWLRKYI